MALVGRRVLLGLVVTGENQVHLVQLDPLALEETLAPPAPVERKANVERLVLLDLVALQEVEDRLVPLVTAGLLVQKVQLVP